MVDFEPRAQRRGHEVGERGSVGRRGRPRGGGNAKGRLLAAARRHLDDGDLGRVSSRALAAEAGVSHSLVNFHFGGRAGLVAAATALQVAPHDVLAAAARGAHGLDLRVLVHGIVMLWEDPLRRTELERLAREVASGGPRSSPLVDYLQHAVAERLQAALGVERGRAATALIAGTLFTRYVLRLPSMTAMTPHEVERMLLRALGERLG